MSTFGQRCATGEDPGLPLESLAFVSVASTARSFGAEAPRNSPVRPRMREALCRPHHRHEASVHRTGYEARRDSKPIDPGIG